MLISYDSGQGARTRRLNGYLRTLIIGNLVFASCIVFFWPIVAGVMAESLSWATSSNIGRFHSLDDLVSYPLNLLWMLPILGSLVAWFMGRMQWFAFGFFCVAFPLAVMSLALCWYYFAPEPYL